VSGLVSGWKLLLALGSCSAHARGFGILPCLLVSLYFLEVLCLGLCLFNVWACVSLYSLGFVSGLVSGWKLRLALGSCSAHARGFGLLPVFVFLCTFLRFYVWACVWGLSLGLCFFVLPGVCVWACVWVEASACTRLMLGSCSGLRNSSLSFSFFVLS
jgi:hypothetical protein